MSLASSSSSYGQVIEYIQGRLYLGSYTHPPTAQTPFPYPTNSHRSPTKRSSKHYAASSVAQDVGANPPVYFSVDDSLLYNAFHADFGPLHIGHLYRFAVQLHDVLGDPANENRKVVFWSKQDSRSRANAACMLACYMVLIQSWPPHLTLAPIAQADPPLMPFRDAGYSQADYTISVQDVVYGVWKAKEEGLCGLRDFSLEEYEKYERVDMGDFNWVTPSFLAFASPQHGPTTIIPPSSPLYAKVPKSLGELESATIPTPFKNVLKHFVSRDIGLVVRLNSELYSPTYFTALGIKHLDMIFDDGTCPPMHLVRQFIRLSHEMITVKHKGIAVHCKAGLGRTGCLIGAYLIYRHGFTANEMIAFMRFMRPGMVVGPQQHWLHLNQGTFREWWFEDKMKEKLSLLPATPVKSAHRSRVSSGGSQPMVTPPANARRSPLGEVNHNESTTGTGTATATASYMDDNLPAPTPGQPRKTSRKHDRHHPYSRTSSAAYTHDPTASTATDAVPSPHHHQRRAQHDPDETAEEEWQVRFSRRTSSSRSPQAPSSVDKRAVSYSTTTTTTRTSKSYSIGGGGVATDGSDVENQMEIVAADAESPSRRFKSAGIKSVNGGVGKVRISPKRNSDRASSGVRKSSGRVVSAGSGVMPTAAAATVGGRKA